MFHRFTCVDLNFGVCGLVGVGSTKTKIQRLHLVVDLERTKSVSDQVNWQYQKVNVLDYAECFNTLPVPVADAESSVRCRYVYGYGVDGSDPVEDWMVTSS